MSTINRTGAPNLKSALISRLGKTPAAQPTWLDLEHALPSTPGAVQPHCRRGLDGDWLARLAEQAARLSVDPRALFVAAARALVARIAEHAASGSALALARDIHAATCSVLSTTPPGRQTVGELLADSDGWLLHRGSPVDAPPHVVIAATDAAPNADELPAAQLAIAFTISGDDACVVARAAAGLFSRQALDEFVEQWLLIVSQLGASAADAPLDDLDPLLPTQRARLLEQWEPGAAIDEAGPLAHEAFDARASAAPGAPAVQSGETTTRYAALAYRAAGIARQLRGIGIGPLDRVAIYAGPGADLVAGILGALETGAAYLILDPARPPAELSARLRDCAPDAVLTQTALAPYLEGSGTRVLTLDANAANDAGAWSDAPPLDAADAGDAADAAAVDPDTPAFVACRTDGDIARAVVATHRNLRDAARGYARAFSLDETDRFLVTTSFDTAATQKHILTPLLIGAQVHFSDARFDPDAVLREIAGRGITVLNVAPSFFNALVDAERHRELSGVRHVFLEGEPVDARHVAPLLEKYPQLRVVALYNTTASVGPVATWTLGAAPRPSLDDTCMLGRPADGVTLRILDARNRPVPPGVAGRVHIGNTRITRTQAPTRQDTNAPHGESGRLEILEDGGPRDTGDLARWHADGIVEYLGRASAPKRGYGSWSGARRVEAWLSTRDGVGDAIAIVRRTDDDTGHERVAYVTPRASAVLSVPDLIRDASAALPAELVPDVIVVLPALPLALDGTLDRARLSAPESGWSAARGNSDAGHATSASTVSADARSETHARDLAYWTATLRDLPAVHNLPLDHPRPAVADHRSGQFVQRLEAPLHRELLQFANSRRVTLFMLVHAAFVAFLARLSGSPDIVVGTPVANRPLPDLAPLVGFFVNTLVLRSSLDPARSFNELLQQSRQRLVDAYQHQQLPFEQLVDALNPARSLAHAPLFQVMLALNNNDDPPLRLAGLDSRPLANAPIPAKFDLSLHIDALPDGSLRLAWEYAAALFEPGTIARFADRFAVLLADAVRRPDSPVSQLAILPHDERRLLLQRWNDTASPYPGSACIHQLVEAQAARFPDRVALHCNGVELTYRALNARANQLALHLRQLGLPPDSLVGVCVERSPDLVVALLAVLKAGAAYLPLDPAYPRERIDYMLLDSRAQCVIASRALALPDGSAVRNVVRLDDTDLIARLDRAPDHNPDPADVGLASHHLAYLIYTSGSTGQPKGVMIEHRNTVAFIHWALHAFPPDAFDGVLASTSVCFDLSVFEIFATLAAAGRIVLVPDVLALPELPELPDGLVRLVNTVPSAIHALLLAGRLPASVRTVNLAGEPLRQSLVDALYEAGVDHVYDLYGPSEDTTYSTFTRRTLNGRPTIGVPIANTQAFVLSASAQLQPVGVPGELHLGGAGLARGYLGRSELTAERFVDNPIHDAPVRRLYRTGDLVRWLPDGHLEFLGRLDQQVKIRGFRIELGEIDARLGACDGVREAAVVALDHAGESQLVAYVVPRDAHATSTPALRAALAAFLPAYMIPAAFVFLPALPLTPNGKLDRKRLPMPDDADRSHTATQPAPPANATEAMLRDVWQTLLQREPIGVTDNFFEIGGHSLLATRMIATVAERMNVTLPVMTAFNHPTIRDLARVLDTLAPAAPATHTPLRPSPLDDAEKDELIL